MKAVGGYFGLELTKGNGQHHPEALAFKSGRASLQYILETVKPALVHIPFYTCDGLLEPFDLMGVKYSFYPINERLEPESLPSLGENEFFLYINYLDLKREYTEILSEKYADKLIIDGTQAFFMKGNGRSWFFNSCRKFFGVPDGSYLYAPGHYSLHAPREKHEDYLVDHLVKRFNGYPEEGYGFFQQNEILCGGEIKGMSVLSEYLLSAVNYEEAASKRRSNFNYLNNRLGNINLMGIEFEREGVPMAYPALLATDVDKTLLSRSRIFIPSFWNDVSIRPQEGYITERKLSAHMLPLPVDHRYNHQDMDRIINAITLSK